MILGFQQSDFALNFLAIFLEGAPYILLGTLISGFIDVYMPSSVMDRMLPKRRFPAILVCGLMGFILPVCECAVVPVMRRLVAKGLPVACAFTYMLAAPILNPITMWSTWHAFSDGEVTIWIVLSRAGMGYLVAITVGLVLMYLPMEKVIKKSLLKTIRSRNPEHKHKGDCEKGDCGHDHSHDDEHSAHDCCDHDHGHSHDHSHAFTKKSKIVAAMRSAMQDCADVAVYFVIGVCLTAMFNLLYVQNEEMLEAYLSNPATATFGMMVLAFLLSVCSTSDAFMAYSFRGVGYGAKMAFMVLGPMLDMKLVFLYQTVMNKRFLLFFSIGVFLFIGVLSLGWEQWDALREWCGGLQDWLKGDSR